MTSLAQELVTVDRERIDLRACTIARLRRHEETSDADAGKGSRVATSPQAMATDDEDRI